MSTVCGRPQGESGPCGQGRGVKNVIFCGRHKWMALVADSLTAWSSNLHLVPKLTLLEFLTHSIVTLGMFSLLLGIQFLYYIQLCLLLETQILTITTKITS